MGVGAFTNALKPIVKGLFDTATTKLGEGLFKASNTEAGVPLAKSVASNAVNNMPGFYGGGFARAKAVLVGGAKTAHNMVMEQLDPVARKTREQFGISRTTQGVAKKTIKTLESPKVQGIEKRKKELLKLNKNITRATNQGDEAKVAELTRQRDAIDAPSLDERELAREAGKEAQGQLSYQFMQNKLQGTPSSILDEKFMDENYFGVLPLTKENFSDMQYIKYWEMERLPNADNIMSTFFDRVKNAWGSDLNVDNAQMFVKKTYASRASANIANEINTNAKADARIRKALMKRGKGFDTAEQMQEYLTKELKDPPSFEVREGALWFGESFKSSAKELGGVNLQTAILPDATAIQVISDVQDLFKLRMPAGQDGLSLSIPLFKNYLKTKAVTPEQKVFTKAQKVLGEQRSGLFDEFNVMESMRTGDAPAMPVGMGGMSSNQTALVKEIAQLKPDSLTLDEWVTYLSKMGIGASIFTPMAEGMLSGSEK